MHTDQELIREVQSIATGATIHEINNEIMGYTGSIMMIEDYEEKIRLFGVDPEFTQQLFYYRNSMEINRTKLQRRVTVARIQKAEQMMHEIFR